MRTPIHGFAYVQGITIPMFTCRGKWGCLQPVQSDYYSFHVREECAYSDVTKLKKWLNFRLKEFSRIIWLLVIPNVVYDLQHQCHPELLRNVKFQTHLRVIYILIKVWKHCSGWTPLCYTKGTLRNLSRVIELDQMQSETHKGGIPTIN